MILQSPRHLRRSSPTRWYVVFAEATERHWWDRLFRTRYGYSHVYALRWDGWNWIMLNPHMGYTDIAILSAANENDLASLIEPAAVVVEVTTFRQTRQPRGRWWAGPMTCVEQIKALLGLSVGRVWTPWQLYRYLVGNGGKHGNLQKAEGSGTDRPGGRERQATAFRSRQINPRGK